MTSIANQPNTQLNIPRVFDSDAPDELNFSQICRICGSLNETVISLYQHDADNILVQRINQYLPIVITRQDARPLVVCVTCQNAILNWHKLVTFCRKTELKLAQYVNENNLQHDSYNIEKFQPKLPESLYPDQEIQLNLQEQHNLTTNVQNERLTTPSLFLMTKEVLNDYFKILNIDEENSDLIYACQVCPEHPAARSVESLCEHLKSSHSSQLYNKDTICAFVKENITFEEVLTWDETFSDSDTETRKVELPNLFCPFCDSAFSSPTRLICHLNQHIDLRIDDGFLCCDRLYSDKKSFVSHLQDMHVNKISSGGLVCKTCGLVASDNKALEIHINEEHSEIEDSKKKIEPNPKCQKFIPAVCPECNKTFSNKYNMLTHMRNHNGIYSKFICNKCNKMYKSRGSLMYHQKVVHEGVLRYLCSMCAEAFPSRAARDTHARLHTGLKPFSCHYCNKSFRAQNTLNRHIDVHLNIRKYVCHMCNKKFRKKTHLDYHLKTHDKKK